MSGGFVTRETPEHMLIRRLDETETLLEAFEICLNILRDMGYHSFVQKIIERQVQQTAKPDTPRPKSSQRSWDDLHETVLAAREKHREERYGVIARQVMIRSIKRDLKALHDDGALENWPNE